MRRLRPHPSDRSPRVMFWRSHNTIAERLEHFVEVQSGPNPLTPDELRRLAEKYPERWGMFAPKGS